ncbi:MAG TPA: hypothetical protein VGY30_11260 [Solirubrobacteraceae bacterium]|jgi:hypothetical protein|nr:hypothetical protein [Solirubrobacteraceae bacterium]
MPSKEAQESNQRNGKLSITLPFEDALRAVLRVKPDGKHQEPSKRRKAPKAAPRPTRRHGTAS